MSDRAEVVLRRIVRDYGRTVIDDPLRVEGLLRDLATGQRREVFLLVQALKAGVVPALLDAERASSGDLVAQQSVGRLRDDFGLAPEAAEWAVQTWADALTVTIHIKPSARDRAARDKAARDKAARDKAAAPAPWPLSVIVTVVGAVIALAFWGALLSGGTAPSVDVGVPAVTNPDTRAVRVAGTRSWTGTPISVSAGQRLTITASGQVSFIPGGPLVGPDGATDLHPGVCVLPGGEHHAGLIARLDNGVVAGIPFLVGHGYSQIVERGGVLVLGVNDTGVENNAGEFTAAVTVTAP